MRPYNIGRRNWDFFSYGYEGVRYGLDAVNYYERAKIYGDVAYGVEQYVQSKLTSFYKKRKASDQGSSRKRRMPPAIRSGEDVEMSSTSHGERFEGGVTNQITANVLKFGYGGKRVNYRQQYLRSLQRQLDNAGINTHVAIPSTVPSVTVVPGAGKARGVGFVQIVTKAEMEAIALDAAQASSGVVETMVSTGVNWATNKFYLKNVAYELTFSCGEDPISLNVPMILDVYYCRCHESSVAGDSTTSLSAIYAAATDIRGRFGGNLDTGARYLQDTVQASPYDIGDLTKRWTIGRHEQYQFDKGKCVTSNNVRHIGKVYEKEYWDRCYDAKAGWTEAVLFDLRSANYANGDGAKGAVFVTINRVFRWKPFMNDYRIGTVHDDI